MERSTIFKWENQFSIAMFVYQRVINTHQKPWFSRGIKHIVEFLGVLNVNGDGVTHCIQLQSHYNTMAGFTNY
jgi:hypothetical protein